MRRTSDAVGTTGGTSRRRVCRHATAFGAVVAVLLMAAMPPASDVSAAGHTRAQAMVTLFGMVQDAGTGKGVMAAAVASGPSQVLTDSTGHYTLTIPYQPVVVLRATALGYNTTFPLPVPLPAVAQNGVSIQFNFSGASGLHNAFINAAGDTLTPFSQLTPASQSALTVNGKSNTPLAERAIVTVPTGAVEFFPLTKNGAAFAGKLSFDKGPGVYELELLSTAGLAVFLLPVYHGVPYAPQLVQVLSPADPPTMSVGQEEAVVLNAVNAFRARFGRKPLTVNAKLAQAARAHSADIAAHNLFDVQPHLSSTGATLAMRAHDAGIAFALVGEGMAHVAAAKDALDILIDSPAHRAAMLDPRYTAAGVGVARAPGPDGKMADGKLVVTFDLLRL